MNALFDAAPMLAAGAVLGSWAVLGVVGLLALFRVHPLARSWLAWLTRVATMIGVFGFFLAVAAMIVFMASLAHFDTGIPEEQKLPLTAMVWVLGICGAGLGLFLASRIRVSRRA